jgi:hypothetical protein
MTQTTRLGKNRTGVGMSPVDARRTTAAAERATPTSEGGELGIVRLRAEYAAEAAPIGSVPPPTTVKGMAKVLLELLKGDHALFLVDKLGERLAFERLGVRLYESLIDKWSVFAGQAARLGDGDSTVEVDLRRIQAEELLHVDVVRRALVAMGADPTALTPSADLVGTAMHGILQVVTDPRTSLLGSLEALLIAELADNAGWELLIGMALELGQEELAQEFVRALAEEREHLRRVRGWVTVGLRRGEPRARD